MSDSTPESSRRAYWIGLLALVGCAVLWSLNGPVIKLLDRADGGAPAVPGATIAALRSLIGGLFVLPFAIRRLGTLRRVAWRWRLGSVLTFTLMTACFVIANTRTTAANAIILQYTSPVWVFVLSPVLLGESAARRDRVWLIPAMAGVSIIFAAQWSTDLAGLIIALGAGLGYGALTVVLRGLRRADASAVVALNLLGSGLLLLPWMSIGTLTGWQWILLLFLGIVQFALPYVIFCWALQRVPAHQAALVVLLEAVLNPLLTWLIVGEMVGLGTLIGGPFILLASLGWITAQLRSGPSVTT
jgi:drug/metabolite transporter (DMT)-like permease